LTQGCRNTSDGRRSSLARAIHQTVIAVKPD
jgi:hypothetical protein